MALGRKSVDIIAPPLGRLQSGLGSSLRGEDRDFLKSLGPATLRVSFLLLIAYGRPIRGLLQASDSIRNV